MHDGCLCDRKRGPNVTVLSVSPCAFIAVLGGEGAVTTSGIDPMRLCTLVSTPRASSIADGDGYRRVVGDYLTEGFWRSINPQKVLPQFGFQCPQHPSNHPSGQCGKATTARGTAR